MSKNNISKFNRAYLTFAALGILSGISASKPNNAVANTHNLSTLTLNEHNNNAQTPEGTSEQSSSQIKKDITNQSDAPVDQTNGTKLIARKILFSNPDKTAVRLSPDGKWISWVAPMDNVLNIWIAPKNNIKEAICLTNDKHRGIRSYCWTYDLKHILYVQDTDGDENWNLFALDIDTKEIRKLSKGEKVHAQILDLDEKKPNELLMGLNNRRADLHDVYRVNIADGTAEMVFQNDKYAGFVIDNDMNLRFGSILTPDGGSEIFDITTKNHKLYCTIPMEDIITTSIMGFNQDNSIMYMQDSRSRNTSALMQIDLKTNTSTILAQDEKADMDDLIVHPSSKKIQAFASCYTRKKWQVLDKEIEASLNSLQKHLDGEIEILSRTMDDKFWIVASLYDNGPVKYVLYDVKADKLVELFSSKKKLESCDLVPMYPVEIPTRDNLTMVGYLSIPEKVNRTKTGKSSQPVPMVLLVHGGPTARDNWGYNSIHQWLANRGYAVLSVNYRGSTGFGKKFITAGYGQWAGKAHDDLIDATNWAIAQGIAIKDKVAIMGGSYGGYATLVGMTMTPDTFACGIDIVGPSNLITLLESVPPYWKPALDMLKVRIGGDHETKEGQEFLKTQSPINFVHNIKRPLLIGQGANDPRVKQAESDQIVKAMQELKIPVTYALYSDEGHGFARPENRLSFYAVVESFLAQILGGDVEEIGDDLSNSSIEIVAGKEYLAQKMN